MSLKTAMQYHFPLILRVSILKIIISALTLIFLTRPVLASSYVSGQIGTKVYSTNTYIHDSQRRMSARLATGYLWPITPKHRIGIEGGVNFFQDVELEFYPGYTEEYTRFSLDALGVYDYALSKRFDLYAKLGAAYVWEESFLKQNGSEYANGRYQSLVTKYGFGAGYNICSNINVNLSYYKEMHDDRLRADTGLLIGVKYTLR